MVASSGLVAMTAEMDLGEAALEYVVASAMSSEQLVIGPMLSGDAIVENGISGVSGDFPSETSSRLECGFCFRRSDAGIVFLIFEVEV